MNPATSMKWKRWTREELRFLREHYGTRKTSWIAKQLGRTPVGIQKAYAKYVK